jgi:hypothetical protein
MFERSSKECAERKIRMNVQQLEFLFVGYPENFCLSKESMVKLKTPKKFPEFDFFEKSSFI